MKHMKIFISIILVLLSNGLTAQSHWNNPIQKEDPLGMPLVETSPFVFKERLYLLENHQRFWDFPGQKMGTLFHEDEVRIRDIQTDKIVSVALRNQGFGTVLTWDERVYVFAGNYGENKPWRHITEITMTSSADLKHWTEPVTILQAAPDEYFFNTAVCRAKDKFVLLYETNDKRWPNFTLRYMESSDLRRWKEIPGALYGKDKYVGGPALYYEGGYYYTLYAEYLGNGYETRITRSEDLVNWEDAPDDRPFVTFDTTHKNIPLHKPDVSECNASDVELCYFNEQTILYFTGGDQHRCGDLQRATYDGTPQQLFEHFFKDTKNPSTIAFDGRELSIDQQAFLSQHDIVALSPAVDGYEGFPIGNGDLGAMAWTPPDKLFFQINKTNTWDDAPDGMFSPWADDASRPEEFTSLRGCGQLVIEPGLPMFDWIYLDDFEGRISLYDGQASWHATGPLGEVRCRSFVAADPSVMVVHYEDNLNEAVDRRIILSRWGSRVFENWFYSIRRDFLLGNEGTISGCEGDETWIEQSTRSLKFAMAAKLVGPDVEAQQLNSREAGYVLNTGKSCSFKIFLSVVTSEEADDPLAKARENVCTAAKASVKKVYAAHRERWAEFWSKSFIDIPDDYIENLWYFNLYQVGSAALGEYPPHFINSLWSWNRDVRSWNHYYQWNQQIYTWPLHTSGHPELMIPYAKWKLEGLDKAIETAKLTHGIEGAFYCDVSNRRGNQAAVPPEIHKNIGPTGLTAMDLWRHYQYTLDREYLEQYAYPVLREVVRFYINTLEKRDDGNYHIPEGLPFEAPLRQLSSNTTCDLAAIRNLFPAFIQASGELKQDKQLRRQTEEVLHNLTPYVITEIPENALTWGPLKPGDPIIGFGTRLETGLPGHPWSTRPHWLTEPPMDIPSSTHAISAQLTPVFPANLVSLDDQGTALFEACRNAALSFNPLPACGHTANPIYFARLGLTEYLPDLLDNWVDQFQIFSQGLFCYWKRDYIDLYAQGQFSDPYSASEHKIRGLTTKGIRDLSGDSDPEQRIELLRQPFAHMGLETRSILEATINEMLLQSHRDKIRVFPAVPYDWASRFKLHAQGGFVVTSERADGEVKYVAIKSMKGQTCRLVNPWEGGEKVYVRAVSSDQLVLEISNASELTFKTVPGELYIVERHVRPLSSFELDTIGGIKNMEPKTKGRAQLGLPRRF